MDEETANSCDDQKLSTFRTKKKHYLNSKMDLRKRNRIQTKVGTYKVTVELKRDYLVVNTHCTRNGMQKSHEFFYHSLDWKIRSVLSSIKTLFEQIARQSAVSEKVFEVDSKGNLSVRLILEEQVQIRLLTAEKLFQQEKLEPMELKKLIADEMFLLRKDLAFERKRLKMEIKSELAQQFKLEQKGDRLYLRVITNSISNLEKLQQYTLQKVNSLTEKDIQYTVSLQKSILAHEKLSDVFQNWKPYLFHERVRLTVDTQTDIFKDNYVYDQDSRQVRLKKKIDRRYYPFCCKQPLPSKGKYYFEVIFPNEEIDMISIGIIPEQDRNEEDGPICESGLVLLNDGPLLFSDCKETNLVCPLICGGTLVTVFIDHINQEISWFYRERCQVTAKLSDAINKQTIFAAFSLISVNDSIELL